MLQGVTSHRSWQPGVSLTHGGARRAATLSRVVSLPHGLIEEVVEALTGTAIRIVLVKSEYFTRIGLIGPSKPFTSCAGRVILDVLSGFFQCFQPRNLEGPSPARTVDLGSSPALPETFHQGISARPLRDAEPESSNAPTATGSMRCTRYISRSPSPRRWQTGTQPRPGNPVPLLSPAGRLTRFVASPSHLRLGLIVGSDRSITTAA